MKRGVGIGRLVGEVWFRIGGIKWLGREVCCVVVDLGECLHTSPDH